MNFSVLKLKADEVYDLTSSFESAALLMSGTVCFQWAEEKREVTRESYFEQAPTVLHLAKEEKGLIAAKSSCELLIMQVPNETYFKPMLFDESNMLENDLRGKGLLNDSSYRVVRTVFDKRNRKESNMVVGEIITFSGHWSSYPPHTHPHPEIYHYRFSEPEGFAFSEDGDEALKVHHNDTLVILDEKAHAHAVAPWYALYTLWFIRHLNNNPYIVPDFKKEHEWTKELSANERAYPVE